MMHRITVMPPKRNMEAAPGENLLQALRRAGLMVNAPCGGDGRCGKCRVLIDGKEALACQTVIDRTMTVTLPENQAQQILTDGIPISHRATHAQADYSLAFDIGTTTVVGFLLKGRKVLASASMSNPQRSYGADVITRIRLAVHGQQDVMTAAIRNCLQALTLEICRDANILPSRIQIVSVVGNPAMQQLLLGINVANLAKVPFSPVLTDAKTIPAKEILPLWENAHLLIVPDIAGFVGADTVACILATGMDEKEEPTLLVDIGTNGEMVLGNKHRMVACSAAAGPALEGANIQFGMGGQHGAIDHVRMEDGQLRCSVIGGGNALGICGSGLIDAVAVALDQGFLNERGKILTEDSRIHLTETVYLTQEDIRQVQLAKGAIAAGIQLMAAHMGITLQDVHTVLLAGAFGTYLNPKSACRIGLLPRELETKITPVGNAAGSGAQILACSRGALDRAQEIVSRTEALELAAQPGFPRVFARNMRF